MILRIALAFMLCCCVSTQAAINMFLNLHNVPGESTDADHPNQIDVLSWSWGMSNPFVVGGGGGTGGGKVTIQDISITKYFDKASPQLMTGCSAGTHYKTAVLSLRKAGASTRDFMVMTMEDVVVTSLNTGGSAGGDLLTENITLNFARVKVEYWEQKADGSYTAVTAYTWNIAANTP